MRHVIVVVGSREQLQQAVPRIQPREGEAQRETTWYACADQDEPGVLLDDASSLLLKVLKAPILAYNLYQQVHSTKLWSGKRPPCPPPSPRALAHLAALGQLPGATPAP